MAKYGYINQKSRGYQNKSAIGVAKQALRRASVVLGRRGSANMGASYNGPPATRGFWGGYNGPRRGVLCAPERKFIDLFNINQVVTNTGGITLINGIPQGMDFNQRIGRKAKLVSLVLNGNFYPSAPPINAPQGAYCRCIIIYDTQPNSGALPAWTDIFVQADPASPMNLNNRDRFKVIFDVRKQVAAFVNTTTTIAGFGNNAYFNKYRALNHEMIFSGTAGTIGSISTGSMYICFISDTNSVTSFDFYTRLRFIDD